MSPASLGDLLEEAETATVRLITARPNLETLAPAWPTYTAAAERMLHSCIGVRGSNNPVDAALSSAATEARTAGAGLTAATQLSGNNDLSRISELLQAAADLLDSHRPPDTPAAQMAGLRTAGVIAGASHMVVVAERTSTREGIALRALRLERAAARALAQAVTPSLLDEPRAAPVSDPAHDLSAGERYEAAALTWRRLAAQDFNPAAHALRTGALSIGHITVDLRIACRAAGLGAEVDVQLRTSQDHWRAVAQAWPGVTTAIAFMPDARAAAERLRSASIELRRAIKAASDLNDPRALTDLSVAAARGHADMVALGHEQMSLARRLGAAGRLYVPARDLPPAEERLAANLRRQLVSAPEDRVGRLIEPYVAATRVSRRAVAMVNQALASTESPWRPPQREDLRTLAASPPGRTIAR